MDNLPRRPHLFSVPSLSGLTETPSDAPAGTFCSCESSFSPTAACVRPFSQRNLSPACPRPARQTGVGASKTGGSHHHMLPVQERKRSGDPQIAELADTDRFPLYMSLLRARAASSLPIPPSFPHRSISLSPSSVSHCSLLDIIDIHSTVGADIDSHWESN